MLILALHATGISLDDPYTDAHSYEAKSTEAVPACSAAVKYYAKKSLSNPSCKYLENMRRPAHAASMQQERTQQDVCLEQKHLLHFRRTMVWTLQLLLMR
jgi:hypothetical protein